MSNFEDKQAAIKDSDTTKGPIAGGSEHKPKIDPADGTEVDQIVSEHQPSTGPKTG